jgi:pseudaminic acid cytidylyltransferase
MKIAVIPARGGSKRIPRKNLRHFHGKPILAWSVDAALESSCFDQVIVSTDDAEIADLAVSHGASVPFVRPADLSDDFTPTLPVVRHAIDWFVSKGVMVDSACCIYATAPFVDARDIRQGLDMLEQHACDFLVSVTEFEYPIQRALRFVDNCHVEMYHPEHYETRSQDLEQAWHDAGQFCWGKARAWMNLQSMFSGRCLGLTLPRSRVMDIDTLEDWESAEKMFALLNKNQKTCDV